MNQEGTIIGSNFERYGLRANLDAQLKPWLKLGLNASYTATSDNLKLADSDEGIINYSLVTPPDIQIYNIDGGYSSVSKEGFTNPNPIAMAMLNEILLDRQKLNGSTLRHSRISWPATWTSPTETAWIQTKSVVSFWLLVVGLACESKNGLFLPNSPSG